MLDSTIQLEEGISGEAMKPMDHLKVSIANHYGLDKFTYAERLHWVNEHLDVLENQVAKEPYLYKVAVQALRDTEQGLPTGYIHFQDAICSGIQILSAISGCKEGLANTGCIDTGYRPDAYMAMYQAMLDIGTKKKVSREDAKQALMTACYGSRKVPEEVFGEDLPIFYKAARTVCPGAFDMLEIIQSLWNKDALSHEWYLPDAHFAFVPVLKTKTVQIEVDELNHYKMSTVVEVNEKEESGISLAANLTHSLDAFVLREMVRSCSIPYLGSKDKDELYHQMAQNALLSDYVSIALLDYRDWEESLSEELIERLRGKLAKQVEFGTFDLVTVHDCFGSHVNHSEAVSYWYRNIMAELADSQVFQFIARQITGDDSLTFEKEGNWGYLIKESKYAIC